MTTITQLEYLVAVEREQHFGKAAMTCHVSQPSLSAQIQKLEEELEIVIFDRSQKPIMPTEIGREIIKQARIILYEHQKLQTIANERARVPKGKFNMAVIPTLATYIIPLFIGHFSETYPKVDLGISEYRTEDIITLLMADEIDAGLLVTPLEDERLVERHLFYEPFYCYLSENHPLTRKKLISGADLDTGDLWLLSEGHCFREQVLNVCSKDKKQSALPGIRFESGNLDTLIKLVKANSGYTLLPQLAVDGLSADEIKSRVKKFKAPVPTREVSLVYKKGVSKQTIIGALEHSILQNLPSQIQTKKKRNIDVVGIQPQFCRIV